MIDAIKNTLFEKPNETLKYPAAYIADTNKSFCLVCETDGSEYICHAFYNFHLLFEELCKKHNIPLLSNSVNYTTNRIVSGSNLIKYEFNISPADMENLLLLEFEAYAGYRGGASISRLLDPTEADIKDGYICLFPLLKLSDEEYMPRQAGCNMSQIISVQLANYIKRYLLADTEAERRDFFGHHNSALTENYLDVDSLDIMDSLAKCISFDHVDHKTEDGTNILKAINTPLIHICDLDENSKLIYQRHGVVTHSELGLLQSGEVPIVDFLTTLQDALHDKISRTKKRLQDEYSSSYIAKSKSAISKSRFIDDIEDIGSPLSPKKLRG